MKKFIIAIVARVKNFFFCLKYPFWKATNVWTGKFIGYGFTWYDDIPEGWRIAFGKDLSDDIKRIGKRYLKSHKGKRWKDVVQFQQIKEKYGTLRIYATAVEPLQELFTTYEYLSMGYCIHCGRPAAYITEGWVEYICPYCQLKRLFDHPWARSRRLSKDDLPQVYSYENGKEKQVSLIDKYGVDLPYLWGLSNNSGG